MITPFDKVIEITAICLSDCEKNYLFISNARGEVMGPDLDNEANLHLNKRQKLANAKILAISVYKRRGKKGEGKKGEEKKRKGEERERKEKERNCNLLIFSSDGKIANFDWRDNCRKIFEIEFAKKPEKMLLAPNGKFLVQKKKENLKLLESRSLGMLHKFEINNNSNSPLRDFCFTQDSEFVIVANEIGLIRVFSTKSGFELSRFRSEDDEIIKIIASPTKDSITILSKNGLKVIHRYINNMNSLMIMKNIWGDIKKDLEDKSSYEKKFSFESNDISILPYPFQLSSLHLMTITNLNSVFNRPSIKSDSVNIKEPKMTILNELNEYSKGNKDKNKKKTPIEMVDKLMMIKDSFNNRVWDYWIFEDQLKKSDNNNNRNGASTEDIVQLLLRRKIPNLSKISNKADIIEKLSISYSFEIPKFLNKFYK